MPDISLDDLLENLHINEYVFTRNMFYFMIILKMRKLKFKQVSLSLPVIQL